LIQAFANIFFTARLNNANTYCIGHRGDCRIRLETRGHAVHSAIAKKPDNALYKLARAITALEQFSTELAARASSLGSASLSVTMAGAGEAPNIVPDKAWLELDRRVLPGESREQIVQEICERVSTVPQDAFELDCYLYFPAYTIKREHRMVAVLSACAAAVTELAREPRIFTASTEALSFLWIRRYRRLFWGRAVWSRLIDLMSMWKRNN